MTIVINLFSGPGSGKSTSAAAIFSVLKQNGIEAELVTEYAKELAWDKAHLTMQFQLHLLGEQYRRLARLDKQVDYIITDSPIMLGMPYARLYQKYESDEFVNALESMAYQAHLLFQNMNFLIIRDKPFSQKGRVHDSKQSDEITAKIHMILEQYNIPYDRTTTSECVEQVIGKISRIINMPIQMTFSPIHKL